ncbi:hypothetical protein Ae356Ps1_6296 [Pseudonocardia sp. Ae356_Ps1]|nr:hypothetical protein Ae356Ps1_6296 [Pseudonocardia sp. Ae356_Ps1]
MTFHETLKLAGLQQRGKVLTVDVLDQRGLRQHRVRSPEPVLDRGDEVRQLRQAGPREPAVSDEDHPRRDPDLVRILRVVSEVDIPSDHRRWLQLSVLSEAVGELLNRGVVVVPVARVARIVGQVGKRDAALGHAGIRCCLERGLRGEDVGAEGHPPALALLRRRPDCGFRAARGRLAHRVRP